MHRIRLTPSLHIFKARQSEITCDEQMLLSSALEFPDIPVSSVMTKLEDVFMLGVFLTR